MQVISATNGETRRHSDGRDSLSAGGQYSPNFGRRVNYRANIITGENRGTRATVAERQRQPAIGASDAHFSLVLGKDRKTTQAWMAPIRGPENRSSVEWLRFEDQREMRPNARLLHIRPDAHFSPVLGEDQRTVQALSGSGSRTCEKCDRMLVFFTYALMRISHQFSARSRRTAHALDDSGSSVPSVSTLSIASLCSLPHRYSPRTPDARMTR